jgi:hypothetical protein
MDSQTPATPSGMHDSPIQDVGTSTRPKGPNASAVVLGLVALILGTLIIAKETMNLHINWSGLGPGAIVAIGFVLVVIGAIGLVRRHDDA